MKSEFEQMLELLLPPLEELLKEQESDGNSDNSLDFQVFPSIHRLGGKND